MKAKLCSVSQRWTCWFRSNTQGPARCRIGSLSRRDYCASLSAAAALLRPEKCFLQWRGGEWIWDGMQPKARTLLLFYKGIMLPQTLCPQHSDAHMLPLAGRDGEMRH